MREIHELQLFVVLCISIVLIRASKCPETRKPHVTSCTIFYNCINLPEGGYVWAPAKCSEGLVFQPYLRICVLPGDSWACDDLSPERTLITEYPEKPQLIDSSQTSYHGNEKDAESLGEHPLQHSPLKIEDGSPLGNFRPMATAYPLIEIYSEDKNTPPSKPKDSTDQSYEQGMKNYLYFLFKSQERLDSGVIDLSSIKDGRKNGFTLLREIMERVLLYENNDRFEKMTNCQSQNNFMKNIHLDEFNKNMMNHLVENYIFGTRISTIEKSRKKNNRKTVLKEKMNENVDHDSVEETNVHSENPTDPLISGVKSENNIIVIEGNLGEKEYITINKYQSLSSEIKLRVIEILPCAKGIRLPNITDCTRYYTCDPETANIVQFSCSSNTAFNHYTRVCDVQRYKTCLRETDEKSMETTTNYFVTEMFSEATEIPEKFEPCRNTGKFVDSMSDKHYFVCYSSQVNPSKIESLRMICPNDLIFCQEKRVCSTRKRCYDN